ncbi:MAG: prepilin-type N-terminal cleavage/methylation domain-containing protein [Clostridia bacterium]
MLQTFYKSRNKKGFTLMEMLIVVAIIAVLVAIAIPVFSSSLDKAKKATDQANIRSAIALASVQYLEDQKAGTYYFKTDGTLGSAPNKDNYKQYYKFQTSQKSSSSPYIWQKGDFLEIKVSSDPEIGIAFKSYQTPW